MHSVIAIRELTVITIIGMSRLTAGPSAAGVPDVDERDAMQLWFEARWARLVAQRRAREEPKDEPSARRLARLERRLTRPLSGK